MEDELEDGGIECSPFFTLKFGATGIFDTSEAEVARKYIRLRPIGDYDQKSLMRMMEGAKLIHRVRIRMHKESVACAAQRFIDADLDLRGEWSAYWFPYELDEYVVFGFSHLVDAVTCKLLMA